MSEKRASSTKELPLSLPVDGASEVAHTASVPDASHPEDASGTPAASPKRTVKKTVKKAAKLAAAPASSDAAQADASDLNTLSSTPEPSVPVSTAASKRSSAVKLASASAAPSAHASVPDVHADAEPAVHAPAHVEGEYAVAHKPKAKKNNPAAAHNPAAASGADANDADAHAHASASTDADSLEPLLPSAPASSPAVPSVRGLSATAAATETPAPSPAIAPSRALAPPAAAAAAAAAGPTETPAPSPAAPPASARRGLRAPSRIPASVYSPEPALTYAAEGGGSERASSSSSGAGGYAPHDGGYDADDTDAISVAPSSAVAAAAGPRSVAAAWAASTGGGARGRTGPHRGFDGGSPSSSRLVSGTFGASDHTQPLSPGAGGSSGFGSGADASSPRRAAAADIRARALRYDTVTRAVRGANGSPSPSPTRAAIPTPVTAAASPHSDVGADAGADAAAGGGAGDEAAAAAAAVALSRRMAQLRVDAEAHRRAAEAAEAARARALDAELRRSTDAIRAAQEERARAAQEATVRQAHERLAAAREEREKERVLRQAAARWVAEKNQDVPRYMKMEARAALAQEEESARARQALEQRREQLQRDRFDAAAVAAHSRTAGETLHRRGLEIQRERIERSEIELYGAVRTQFDAENRPLAPGQQHDGAALALTHEGGDAAGGAEGTFLTSVDHQGDDHGDHMSGDSSPRGTKWRPSMVPVSRVLQSVRAEARSRGVANEVREEQARVRLMRAKEYAMDVPVPAPDLTKAKQAERARTREEVQRQIIATKQAEGEEMKKKLLKDGSLARRLVQQGARELTDRERELIQRNRAAHAKAVSDQCDRKERPDYLSQARKEHERVRGVSPRGASLRRAAAAATAEIADETPSDTGAARRSSLDKSAASAGEVAEELEGDLLAGGTAAAGAEIDEEIHA